MDFRLVGTDLIWKRGHGASIVATTPSGGKVAVQTPKCSCSVSLHSPGVYKVSMVLKRFDSVHVDFEAWLRRIEESASGPWKTQRELRSAVYSSSFSIMAFSDTMVYDESGRLSAELSNAKSCSALIELSGAWTSEGLWGPRWKILQLKIWDSAETECSFQSSDSEAGSEADSDS